MGESVIDGYRRVSLIRRDVTIEAQPLNERAEYAHGQRFLHDGPILRCSPLRRTAQFKHRQEPSKDPASRLPQPACRRG